MAMYGTWAVHVTPLFYLRGNFSRIAAPDSILSSEWRSALGIESTIQLSQPVQVLGLLVTVRQQSNQ